MLYIIDCASHQGLPDWAQLKAEGHAGMITKVTGEGHYVNPYWEQNVVAAKAAGLVTGVYDWVQPQMAAQLSPREAAADYLRVVGGHLDGALLTVDFEDPEWHTGPLGRNIEEYMRVYLYALKELSGKEVIVYTAPYFLAETGARHWSWGARDFHYWIAAPGNATGTHNMLPDSAPWPSGTLIAPWVTAVLHQHQWFARSSAVRQHFDRNRFNGTMNDLLKLAGQQELSKGEGIVREPAAGKFTAYENDKGEAVFVWNMGGEVGPDGILGIHVGDLGMTVDSATEPGKQVSRSIQSNEVHLFHTSDRRRG